MTQNHRILLLCEFRISDWSDEKVDSPSMLKLIYHGRFLHQSVTLNALQLPQGKITVMHLVARENLPQPNASGKMVFIFNLVIRRDYVIFG